ncbi:MAG TPA: hypothetical protein DCX89_04990, partial [Saprospirales bacterium]|nr:hypothetical protein [Saprospirales bacterium]
MVHSGLFGQEYYLKLKERDRNLINEHITRVVSIHKIEGENIYAFANEEELAKIRAYGYAPELLKHPSDTYRNLDMATNIDQMADWDRYPTYEVYRAMMKRFEAQFPELCRLDSIGTTIKGRKLYVLKITSQVDELLPKPEMFYTSSIHGNETTGFVLMLRLADHLLQNYGSDSRVTKMLNESVIYLNPAANPDGTYKSGNHTVAGATRGNANGKDMNRNFPDPRVGTYPSGPHQPETIAMMEFAQSKNLSLSANFHDGAELINYPWDAWVSSERKHADHNWFEAISIQWADQVHSNSPQGYFFPGYTHGGDWYVVAGGRQDYMNYWHHCREVTLELHDNFLTATELLPSFWNYQKESLLSYIEWLQTGVSGTVMNEAGVPLEARITVLNHDKDESWVRSNPYHGHYLRMLEPGTWQLEFSAFGYVPQVLEVEVTDIDSSQTLNVILKKAVTTSIAGRVYEFGTNKPLKDVEVSLKNTPHIALTDSSGWFQMDSVSIGNFELRIAKEGFITSLNEVELDTTQQIIELFLFPGDPESFEEGLTPGFLTETNPWTIVNDVSYDGLSSLKSGEISHNRTSTVSIPLKIAARGEISFALKTSSEASYDFLKFYINGEEKAAWSGETDWTVATFAVDTGMQVFEWKYIKDQADTGGSDAAWIDQIVFPQSFQQVSFEILSSSSGEPVNEALIQFDSKSQLTDQAGIFVFSEVLRGTKIYEVSKDGFQNVVDTLVVSFVNVFNKVYLEEIPTYSIMFTVIGSGLPVKDAKIEIYDNILWTDNEGTATTHGLFARNYEYIISAEGYNPYTGVIDLKADTQLVVMLSPVLTEDPAEVGVFWKAFPNPFSDQLHLMFKPDSSGPLLIEVFDPAGKRVFEINEDGMESHGSSLVL